MRESTIQRCRDEEKPAPMIITATISFLGAIISANELQQTVSSNHGLESPTMMLYLVDTLLSAIVASSILIECAKKAKRKNVGSDAAKRGIKGKTPSGSSDSLSANAKKTAIRAKSMRSKSIKRGHSLKGSLGARPKGSNDRSGKKERSSKEGPVETAQPDSIFNLDVQPTVASPPKTNLDSLREENPLAKAYKSKIIEPPQKVEQTVITPEEKMATMSFYQMDRSELVNK
ncbi:hypothetical protein Q1695_001956 [Nippostrongylus brasiliensis]|nr:hypothetical protein Q1695_001956 [Nippostrongylus brasiliensis]